MIDRDWIRRRLLLGGGLAASGLVLMGIAGCASAGQQGSGEEVGAVEDLMREHGIIRRAILVYRSIAFRLHAGERVDPQALRQTATLLRTFGEDYHERMLEEAYIFPAIRKAGGAAAGYVDVLLDQHRKGRDLTGYVLGVASKSSIPSGEDERLATALEQFELMYEHHAAREDMIVFPAWKATLSESGLAEMGEKFEEIEHRQFGDDGFDAAVAQIDDIERNLGLGDLAQFTPRWEP